MRSKTHLKEQKMSDMIKRDDVLRIIDDRFSRTMIGDILKQDINALPEAEAIYVCDRKKCEDCNPLCDFTRDINHAGTIDKVLIIDRKKEDIKLAPKGRQCKIDRCDLFNRLATITAEDANEMKAKIYAVIQEMPALPDKAIAHVHLDTEELLERIREEYELTDEPQGDGIIVRSNMPPFRIAEPQTERSSKK